MCIEFYLECIFQIILTALFSHNISLHILVLLGFGPVEWDTSKVTNLYETFSYAESFTGDISKWDVSNVWKMFGLFNGECVRICLSRVSLSL